MSEHSIFVTRKLPGPAIEERRGIGDVRVNLEDRVLTREELRDGVRDKDALLCLLTDKVDGEVMDESPRLKVISNVAVGYDNIDVNAATTRGIFITNTPRVLTETVADLGVDPRCSAEGRRSRSLSSRRTVEKLVPYTTRGKRRTSSNVRHCWLGADRDCSGATHTGVRHEGAVLRRAQEGRGGV